MWALVTTVKVLVAAQLPLFVDEAFYWQEGQHLAAAYSDLPGLTAWLTRLGVEVFGDHRLGVRLPFLLMGALLPWLVARITTRWFGARLGGQAGTLALLMPLSATLGILAVPDVPLAIATLLCLDAGARLLRGIDAAGALLLALGLSIGALSHYRFIGVIGMGFIVLMWLPEGRRVLRDPRVWIALAVGMLAWLPLLAWNLDNHDAGLKFQVMERHPWAFSGDGLRFLLVQPLMVTPLLFVVLMAVAIGGMRNERGGFHYLQWRYFALVGGVSTLLIFVLGFFTDVERISFHWPLPGYLALLIAAPVVLSRWPRVWRRVVWVTTSVGLVCALCYYLVVSVPGLREQMAGSKYYPRNFAGWQLLAEAVRETREDMPADTELLADNFKVGAELGFRLNESSIRVLPHQINDHHGRTAQLGLWGLLSDGRRQHPQLLVLAPSDERYRELHARYQQICALVGPLPPPQVVSLDHGFQRFLLFKLPAERQQGECVLPAMAWLDAPVAGQVVRAGQLEVKGWAFKDGVGLSRVELLVDGHPVGDARYGRVFDVRSTWPDSNDPQHPHVGLDGSVDTRALKPGRHWLGMRLHGKDGSVEAWAEQPFVVE